MIAAPCDFQAFQETSKLKYQEAVYCLNYRDKRLSPLFQSTSPAQSKPVAYDCSINLLLATEGRKRREGEPDPHPAKTPMVKKKPPNAQKGNSFYQSGGSGQS